MTGTSDRFLEPRPPVGPSPTREHSAQLLGGGGGSSKSVDLRGSGREDSLPAAPQHV